MNLQATLSELPPHTQLALLRQLQAIDFSGQITDFKDSPSLLLPLAASFSVAPISGFHVGAVALGASGSLYLGANLELTNTPLSATLHAEQSAVLNARSHGESSITALAISEAPCGYCRQFLRELSGANQLIITVGNTHTDLAQLLPMAFGATPQAGQGLLDSPAATFKSPTAPNDPLAQLAVDAAQRSYTPYTKVAEGFAIECSNGQQFLGSNAESIAFNPSIPAVLCALNQRNLSNSREVTITRCTHAECSTSSHTSRKLATSAISSISNSPVLTVHLEQ